jgi:hypothetical protein
MAGRQLAGLDVLQVRPQLGVDGDLDVAGLLVDLLGVELERVGLLLVARHLHVYDGLPARYALQLAIHLLQQHQRDVVGQLVVAAVADLQFAFDLPVVVTPGLDLFDLGMWLWVAGCRASAGGHQTSGKHEHTSNRQQCSQKV